jgi:hypothetical protein
MSMIGLVLAGVVLAGTAAVIARNPQRPQPKRVPIKAKDRKDPHGR